MMRSSATGIVIAVLGILLTLGLALAKSIETSDPESYQRTNQLDVSIPIKNLKKFLKF